MLLGSEVEQMKVYSMEVKLDHNSFDSDEIIISMHLKKGNDTMFRTWKKEISTVPQDPVECWQLLQQLVAQITPPPVNEDTDIEKITQKLPSSAIQVIPGALTL